MVASLRCTADQMRPAREDGSPFTGYGVPAFIPIPTVFVRWQMAELSLAERTVMLYIFAQTYGCGQPHSPVSLRAMRYGRRVGGQPVDQGVGLDPPELLDTALDALVARQFLFRHPYTGARSEPTTIYELNVDGRAHYGLNVCRGSGTEIDSASNQCADGLETPPDPLADPATLARPGLQERIAADTAAIQQQLAEWGVSDSHARGLAALSAQRDDPPTYIADLLAYVTSVPDVQNPLALLDHLCRQGLTRSAPKHQASAVSLYRYGTRPTTTQMDRLRQGWIARVQANPGLIRYSVEARVRHPEDYAEESPLEETYPELAAVLAALQAEIVSDMAAETQAEGSA